MTVAIPISDTTRRLDLATRYAIHGGAWFVMLFSLYGVAALLLLFFVARFKEIFHDFRLTLSVGTQFVMSFQTWFAEGYGWLVILAMVIIFPAPLALITTFIEPDQRRRRILASLLLLAALLGLALNIAAGLTVYMAHVRAMYLIR
jgi:type II secretory pathway component PulF